MNGLCLVHTKCPELECIDIHHHFYLYFISICIHNTHCIDTSFENCQINKLGLPL